MRVVLRGRRLCRGGGSATSRSSASYQSDTHIYVCALDDVVPCMVAVVLLIQDTCCHWTPSAKGMRTGGQAGVCVVRWVGRWGHKLASENRTLHVVLRTFELEPVGPLPLPDHSAMVVGPKHGGCTVRFKRRASAATS